MSEEQDRKEFQEWYESTVSWSHDGAEPAWMAWQEARARFARASCVAPEEFTLVPVEPTEEQWGGLARDIMQSFLMADGRTPRALLAFLESIGREIPQWLRDEPEMRSLDHTLTKGTRCVMIYRAMVEAAPRVNE